MIGSLRVTLVHWVAIGGLLAIIPALRGATPEQSISTSRQFIVYGTDVRVRGAICDLAERTKGEVLGLLEERDAWTTPIVVNARYPQANLPELPRLGISVGQTGFGLKLQLDLAVDAEISRPEVRRELLRAVLIEMMFRGQPNIPAGAVYDSPPDWLLDGIPGEQPDLPHDRVTNLLGMPVAAGTVLTLEKFLQQRPELLDAPGRLLYRAYSVALVDLLSRAREGPRRLARFIVDLPSAPNDPLADLRHHFPGVLDSDDGAEKSWEKQIARLSTPQPYQLMGSAETERTLEQKLRLKFPEQGAEKSYELGDFGSFLKDKSAKSALAVVTRDLSALAARAHPVYAPIVAEYSQLTALLQRGKTKGVARRLERLEASRRALTAQMSGIDDYLNWFEATRLARPSGAFADYMKAADSVAQEHNTKRDPISVYLDVLEAQFEK